MFADKPFQRLEITALVTAAHYQHHRLLKTFQRSIHGIHIGGFRIIKEFNLEPMRDYLARVRAVRDLEATLSGWNFFTGT